VSPVFFPPPSRIAVTLWNDLARGTLAADIRATLLRTIPALLLGGIPGMLLGLAMGWSRRLRRVAEPFVAAFHPIPKLALLPLFIVILGIGEAPRIVVIAVAAFFPILINAMAGVREISPVHFDVAANYRASPVRILRRVVLPGSLPFVLAGVRVAANIALVTAIAVEMIAAGDGLGARVWLSWQVLRTEQLYATLAVIAAAGIGLNVLLAWSEARLVPWRPGRGTRS
jgi:NitT/TauT family transport system permease protein